MPKKTTKPKAVKARAIVSATGKIIAVSLGDEEDTWHEAGQVYGFRASYADSVQFLKDNGYRCIPVLITPLK